MRSHGVFFACVLPCTACAPLLEIEDWAGIGGATASGSASSSSASTGGAGGAMCAGFEPDVGWRVTTAGTSTENDARVVTSSNGSVVLTASFDGTLGLGNSPIAKGAADVLVARLSPEGELVELETSDGTALENARAIGVRPDGTAIAAGRVDESISFGGLAYVALTPNAFLAALPVRDDVDPAIVIASSDPPAAQAAVRDLVVTPSGEAVVGLLVRDGAVAFGGGTPIMAPTTAWSHAIAKVDVDLSTVWALDFAAFAGQVDDSDASFSSMAVDLGVDGTILFAGEYAEMFEIGSSMAVDIATKNSDVFFKRIAGDGSATLVDVRLKSEGPVRAPAVAARVDGSAILAVEHRKILTDTAGNQLVAEEMGLPLLTFVEIGKDGTLGWVTRLRAGKVAVHAVEAAPDGTMYACGEFTGTLELEAHVLVETTAKAAAFVASLSRDGELAWVYSFGDENPSASASCTSLALAGDDVVVAGAFSGKFSIGDQPFEATNQDVFVARLSTCR